jgi:hypothetical protein
MRTVRPPHAVGRRDVLAGAAATILVHACRSRHGEATPVSDLRPEDPVDESFRGCQLSSSCGARSTPDGVTMVLQPGARIGDYTRCLVSGAVFQVSEQRQRRTYGGHDLFFCCAACARYFDLHAEVVATLRHV